MDTTLASGYSAGARKPSDENGSVELFTLDGVGNGKRFTKVYGKRVRYCYELETWFAWTGKRWSSSAPDVVQRWAKRTGERIRKEIPAALAVAEREGRRGDDLDELRKAYQRHIRSTCGSRGIKEMLEMAESELGVKTKLEELDREPLLLNVLNGTIDLKTGALRPHRRGDALTKLVPVRFNPQATCPRWLAFLARIFSGDRELIDYIQRAVGYSLTGSVSEQCLFFLFGNGANGKSVFVQTLLHLFGEYGQKAPTEMLMKQDRSSGGAFPEFARLCGVRLAVTAELEEGKQFGEAKVKDLTGADRIVARPLYCDHIEFDPTRKLWIYGNHRPTIRGVDDGIWRRIRLIPFQVTIPEGERDPQLMKKLEAEAEGILTWAVQGCVAWQRDGLAAPPIVTSATDAYLQDSDQLPTFLDDCCIVATEAWISKGDLYEAYRKWAERSGERPVGEKQFGEGLSAKGFQESRSRHSRNSEGIGLLVRHGAEVHDACA